MEVIELNFLVFKIKKKVTQVKKKKFLKMNFIFITSRPPNIPFCIYYFCITKLENIDLVVFLTHHFTTLLKYIVMYVRYNIFNSLRR